MKVSNNDLNFDPALLLAGGENEPVSYEVWSEEDRIVFINNEINSSLRGLFKFLYRWSKEDLSVRPSIRKPVKLLIDSVGGDASVTRALVDIMSTMVTPVYTYNLGECSSAATYIFAAGFKRFSLPNSSFMFHDGIIGLTGTTEKVFSSIDHAKNVFDRLTDDILWETNIKKEDLDKRSAADWYLFADEALELGLVDEIIEDFDSVCV